MEIRQLKGLVFLARLLFYFTVWLLYEGCIPAKENPKYLFTNGTYNVRSGIQKSSAYIEVDSAYIKVYKKDVSGNYNRSDYSSILLADTSAGHLGKYSFIKSSFDLDVISIPLKFRPSVKNFPAQLNTTLNGGIFVGRRADVYKIRRRINTFGIHKTSIEHYGISVGVFSGIGSAVMNPSVTLNAISTEYDALVIPLGVNTLVGFNNVTFGIAVGIDNMASPDRKFWIYWRKPWIGLTVGLNLN